MSLQIRFTEEGREKLHELHIENQKKIKTQLKNLSKNIQLGKPLLGRLIGFYSFRIGNYRAIYTLENERILVHYVGHRKDVYDKVGR
jgi:mRNA interferase RelE/StbE